MKAPLVEEEQQFASENVEIRRALSALADVRQRCAGMMSIALVT